MSSWLSTTKKLSFIQNTQDKKEGLNLLDAALKDPKSSYEHKLRRCLLINKLYPTQQNITALIIQTIFLDISKNIPVASKIKIFASEFSQDHIQQMITSLSAQLQAISCTESGGATALGAILPYGSKTLSDELITPFLTGLNDEEDEQPRAEAAPVLSAVLPYVSKTLSFKLWPLSDLDVSFDKTSTSFNKMDFFINGPTISISAESTTSSGKLAFDFHHLDYHHIDLYLSIAFFHFKRFLCEA